MSTRRGRIILLLSLTAVAALARAYFLLAFGNWLTDEMEAYSRFNMARQWLSSDALYPGVDFGPLHTWLLMLLLRLFRDPLPVARLISLICGTAAVPLAFGIAEREFNSRAGALAAVLLAFYPLLLRASAVSLPEAIFVCAFLAGLLALLKAGDAQPAAWRWTVLSVICFASAGMLRFEAWLAYPILCLFALRRSPARGLVFSLLLAAFPLVHMYAGWAISGDPLRFSSVSAQASNVTMSALSLSRRALAWPHWMGLAMSPVLLALGLSALIWVAFRRRWLWLSLIGLPLALLFARTLQGRYDPSNYRYLILWGALLLIPAAGMIEAALLRIYAARRGYALVLSAIALALAAYEFDFSNRRLELFRLPAGVVEQVDYLRRNSGPQQRVLLESELLPYYLIEGRLDPGRWAQLEFTWGPDPLQLEQGRPHLKHYKLTSARGSTCPYLSGDLFIDWDKSAAALERFRPTHIVLNCEWGCNIQYFPLAPDSANGAFEGLELQRVLHNGPYAIYEVRYP